MAEYIKRNAIKERLEDLVNWCQDLRKPGLEQALAMLNKEPVADVAPVVRCKDCKHSWEDLGGLTCSHGVCVDCVVLGDFYCANGERRARTIDDISIKELGPGVILEGTKPDGERYGYSIPTWPPGDGGPGYRGHELEIDVFYGGGGGDAER